MVRKEPEVLAATRKDPGAESKGAPLGQSALVVFALFFLEGSSPSVASSMADMSPPSGLGCLGGLPLGFPVFFLLGAFDEDRLGFFVGAGAPDPVLFDVVDAFSGAGPWDDGAGPNEDIGAVGC